MNKCQKCGQKTKNPKFCSRSCSVSTRNRLKGTKRFCVVCSKELNRSTGQITFCSKECYQKYHWEKTEQKIVSGEHVHINTIRKHLLRTRKNICSICGIDSWLGKPVVFIMDHINGNPLDNSLENLRLICSNCDAQLPTYKSKNKNSGRHSRRQRYKDGKSY